MMKNCRSNWSWYQIGRGYLINQGKEFCYSKLKGENYKIYGAKIGQRGDIIKMIVNLQNNKSSIKYIINGKDYGIAWDKVIKTMEYRLAVGMSGNDKNAKVQLL